MEAKRILCGRTFLAVLALLVTLNGFFFVYQTNSGSPHEDAYHQAVETLAPLDWQTALDRCDAYDAAFLQSVLNGTWENDMDTTRFYEAAELLREPYEHLLSYGDYLEKIERDAKKLQAVSLFSDPNSFAYKNTVKTVRDFSAMKGRSLSAGHDLAVTAVFEDAWADFSVLIVIGLACGLFLSERKEGMWPMIFAAPGGRRKLAWKRAGILLASAWIATILIIGSKILLSGWLYHGLGEWGRTLQSIPMFRNVPLPLTVGQFWLFYLTVKAMGVFLIGLALWAVLSAISNLGLALCAIGLLAGAEYACTMIPSSSLFAILRYCNVFSYIHYLPVFSRYLNLSFFGILISGNDLVLSLLLPLSAAFTLLNVAIAQRKRPFAPANRLLRWVDGIRKRLSPKITGSGSFLPETRKLLFRRKGILLLLALVFLLNGLTAPPREYNPLDVYLQYYEEKFAGPITEQTVIQLQNELETATEADQSAALQQLLSFVRQMPQGAWLVPTGPYDAIWSGNLLNYHRSTALVALLFLALILSPIASQERQFQMHILLHSTPAGRSKLWRRKQCLLLGVTVLIWMMVYGWELIKTGSTYSAFQCLGAPVSSLPKFPAPGWTLTIGQTMAVYYGLKLLVLISAAEACYLLSSLCEKNKDAILLCTGVVLLPAALSAIGSPAGGFLSFLLPLSGIQVLNDPAPFLAAAAAGTVSAAASYRFSC